MERGKPLMFVYRPMPDSKSPEQTIRFDDLLDAFDFADNLMKECKKKGALKLIKANRTERRR